MPPASTVAPRRSPARPIACSRRSASVDRLAGYGCPIQGIRVSDGLEPGALDFEPDADERRARPYVRESSAARRAARSGRGGARCRCPDEDSCRRGRSRRASASPSRSIRGAVVTAPLLIAAEGRNSPTRESAGLKVARWTYDHAALVTSLHHEISHENIAYEIFYPKGPSRSCR